MESLRFFDYNLPIEYRDKVSDEQSAAISIIKQGVQKSIEQLDYEALCTCWIPAINRYINIYALKNADRAELISKLFGVITTPALKVSHLFDVLRVLDSLVKRKGKLDLTLSWKVGYKLFESFAYQAGRNSVFLGKQAQNMITHKLADFLYNARKLYDKEAADQIIGKFKKLICISSDDLYKAAAYLVTLIPNTLEVEATWFEFMFDLWHYRINNQHWDQIFIRFFSTTSKHHLEIDWSKYQGIIYDRLLRKLSIVTSNKSKIVNSGIFPVSYSLLCSKKWDTHNYIAKWVVFMLREEDQSSFEAFSQLMKNLHTYFHPNNETNSYILDFLRGIPKYLCVRKRMEATKEGMNQKYVLSDKSVRRVLDEVWNSLRFSMHGKFNKSLVPQVMKYMSYLDPEYCIPRILERIDLLLDDYNISQNSQIETLKHLMRIILDSKLYPQGLDHLSKYLSLTLAHLSAADLRNVNSILGILEQIGSMMLLWDISSYKDEEALLSKSETMYNIAAFFSAWTEDFFEQLLMLLTHLEEDPEKADSKYERIKNHVKGRNKSQDIKRAIGETFGQIVSSISISQYKKWVDTFINFIKRGAYNNAIGEVSKISACLCMKDADYFLGQLLDTVTKRLIKRNGAESSLEDRGANESIWLLGILSEAIL
jgi:hypothetical protein